MVSLGIFKCYFHGMLMLQMYERSQIIEKLVLEGSEVVRRVHEFTGICTLKDFTTINILMIW